MPFEPTGIMQIQKLRCNYMYKQFGSRLCKWQKGHWPGTEETRGMTLKQDHAHKSSKAGDNVYADCNISENNRKTSVTKEKGIENCIGADWFDCQSF